MIRVLICGVNGQMGHVLSGCIAESNSMEVVAGVDIAADFDGADFPVYKRIADCDKDVDVVIDFSRPAALKFNLAFAREHHAAIVLATTGYTESDKFLIAEYSRDIPIFFSANMSLGVNLQIDLCKKAAEFLADSADIEIIEKHHNKKVDAPSGTALALAQGINSAFSGQKDFTYGRYGTDAKRKPAEIGIHAIRGGNIVGEHQVLFIGPSDILEITHKAQSKQVFALGAMRAAAYLVGKPAGLYDMNDMIAENNTRFCVEKDNGKALFAVDPCSFEGSCTLLESLAGAKIPLGLISQESDRLRFVVDRGDAATAEQALQALGLSYSARRDIAQLDILGINLANRPALAAKVQRLVLEAGISLEFCLAAGNQLSLYIPSSQADTTADLLKNSL